MNDARTTISHGQAQLVQDVKTLLNDVEELLRHASQGGDEGFNNARAARKKSQNGSSRVG